MQVIGFLVLLVTSVGFIILFIQEGVDFSSGNLSLWGHDYSALFGVILFNFALIYHMHGMESGKQKAIDKALSLYKFALKALLECPKEAVEALRIVELAICSNLGHIHAFVRDQEGTLRYRELLRSKLPSTQPRWLSLRDYTFFFFNVLIAQSQDFKLAPAA